MKIFKLMVMLSAAVSVCLMGCGGDDNPTNNNGNNNSGNNNNTSGNNTVANNTCGKDGTAGSCKSVNIGDQTWMAENLNRETEDSWCYNNNPYSCAKYGRLYTWKAAKVACPNGWHLPTRNEWDMLIVATSDAGELNNAAGKLKSKNGWNDNTNGTDDFGFSALPGGSRIYFDDTFHGVGVRGIWWTGTEFDDDEAAWYQAMEYSNYHVSLDYTDKSHALSVRCLEDA